jgi:hypothetical protein
MVVQVTASPTAKDFSFSPKAVTVSQGTGARWTFTGPSDHTVTDATGLGLFDSGPKGPGATFLAAFLWAGNYPYLCTLHVGMTGTVKVPLLVAPPTGGLGTQFTVTWASASPPSGLFYDVQIKRPGSSKFTNWKTKQVGLSAVFVPDSGTGVYSFKARVRNPVTKAATKYSLVVTISVS